MTLKRRRILLLTFLGTIAGDEIKGQTRAEALAPPNPLSFCKPKQECWQTTAEDLELLPAVTATEGGTRQFPRSHSCQLLQHSFKAFSNPSLPYFKSKCWRNEGIVQVGLFQVCGIKNKTQDIFVSMEKGSYFLAIASLVFHFCQWDITL